MPKEYHYCRLGPPYLCLEQSAISLLWHLLIREKIVSEALGFNPGQHLYGFKKLWRHLRSRSRATAELRLPVRGHVCLRVNRGHKVFHLRRQTVTKVFSADQEQAIVDAEIENVRRAGELDFTPSIRAYSHEERWYEEDFAAGQIGYVGAFTSTEEFLEEYLTTIQPCVEKMILAQPPVEQNLPDYAASCLDAVQNLTRSAKDVDPYAVETVLSFMEATAAAIRSPQQIWLVFSHGDFSLQNLLRVPPKMICIDWESAKDRSLLYDFYNYFFTELHYRRAQSDLVAEVQTGLDSLASRLTASAPTLAKALPELAPTYRQLYYLERTRTFLERGISKKTLDVTLTSIEAFRRFEDACQERTR